VAVEQEVAQRAAADRGERRDDDHAEQVELTVARREHAAGGEHRHAGEVEVVEEHQPGRRAGGRFALRAPNSSRAVLWLAGFNAQVLTAGTVIASRHRGSRGPA